jgi:hypothetical protein
MSAPLEYLTDDEADLAEDDEAIDGNIFQFPQPTIISSILAESIAPIPFPQPVTPPSELEPPTDFDAPPESFDRDRMASMAVEEPDEVEIDPLLQAATANVVKVFQGEVIDRSHDLFAQITKNK